MGGKNRGKWGSTLKKGPGASMLNRILGGKCGIKQEVREIEGSAGGNVSTEMWNESQAKQQWLVGK